MEKDDLSFDLKYGYWFNLLCERLYSRLDVLLNFVQLVGGSSAALAALNDSPKSVVTAGVALATCAAVSLLVQPSVKAERHRVARCNYLTLDARLDGGSTEGLVMALADLRREAPIGFGILAVPAFNATLRATNRETSVRALTPGQWLAQLVA
ncbi:hypothetical protein ACSFA2_20800 [Variovorax sp. LT2P21]|uniref:hypothetical protein n=1 Tax=Variovorax sp. LT2P21 TaxID=3443731 RepID=UPI003F4586C9